MEGELHDRRYLQVTEFHTTVKVLLWSKNLSEGSQNKFCLCLFLEAMQGFHAYPWTAQWMTTFTRMETNCSTQVWTLRTSLPAIPVLPGWSLDNQHSSGMKFCTVQTLSLGSSSTQPQACSPIISKCHILFLVRLSQMTPYKTTALVAYLESCRLSLLHLHIHTFCFASVYLFLACIPHFRPWAPFSTDSAPQFILYIVSRVWHNTYGIMCTNTPNVSGMLQALKKPPIIT